MDIQGSKLTTAREAAGLSMNALAKASGVSRTYISVLEQDKANNPSSEKIQMIANALSIPSSSLALDEPPEGARLLDMADGADFDAPVYVTRRIGGRLRTVRA